MFKKVNNTGVWRQKKFTLILTSLKMYCKSFVEGIWTTESL